MSDKGIGPQREWCGWYATDRVMRLDGSSTPGNLGPMRRPNNAMPVHVVPMPHVVPTRQALKPQTRQRAIFAKMSPFCARLLRAQAARAELEGKKTRQPLEPHI